MKTRSTLLLSAALTLSALVGSARADVITSDPSLPVLYPTGFYTNQFDLVLFSGPGLVIALTNEEHRAIGPVLRTPSGPNEIEDFPSQMIGWINVNGSPFQPASANGPVQTEVFGKIGNTTGTFDTEMLSMSLTGTSPFGPFMIRESPTLASTGQTTIADLGGGQYHIDSFFDVFTELSVDGGNTWMPANGPAHMTLEGVPEPSVCALVGLGAGLLALRRARRSRK
ncbi:MAG: PEP-CTERM sorting domain-containing protein [Verrucomicrobia bacterium]|nr:PEP-CTERM sorting domain-containing protein [Verrucomicrobiota bacterium]